MAIQKSSLQSNNGSIQTFVKDGNHIPTEAIDEYVLLESLSIPVSTTRVFKLRDRLLTLQPLVIWFTPSATSNFTFIVRQDTTTLYTIPLSTGGNSSNLPIMFVKPSQEIVLTTPATLSLTNVLIICKEVAYSEILNGI